MATNLKPITQPIPEMVKFRALVKSKGWTHEEVRDLLRDGVMSLDPPSIGAVRNWITGAANPRAEKIHAIDTFNKTFDPKGHRNSR